MKAKKTTWIIIFFGVIGVMLFLFFAKPLSIPENQKPTNIIGEKKDMQNKKATLSCEMNQKPKEGKKHKDSQTSDEDLKFLVELEVTQDFDEYIKQLDDYFYIDEQTIEQMVPEIQIKNDNLVTNEQLTKFHSDLKNSILAYKQGDVNAIMEDIQKAEYKITPKATAWHLNMLGTQYLKTHEEQLPDNPNEAMRLLISRNYGGENGSGYKDICNELSVKGSSIEFHEIPEIPETIHDKLFRLMDLEVHTFVTF